jgi:uncharacterized protein (TIGR03790 family)
MIAGRALVTLPGPRGAGPSRRPHGGRGGPSASARTGRFRPRDRFAATAAGRALTAIGLLFAAFAGTAAADPGIGPHTLAVVVNTADPQSVAIADYYTGARAILPGNVIRVAFPAGTAAVEPGAFRAVLEDVRARTPATIQAYALTWLAPYRVGCMSVTAAFAFGYDEGYCARGCEATRPSSYFQADSRAPWDDHRIRPSMLVAASTIGQARALIDRGIAADGTRPYGTGYLLDTSDRLRNVRAVIYPEMLASLGARVRLRHVRGDFIEGRDDVLFYFTGAKRVPKLDTLGFEPGAMADHLTSSGGLLTGGGNGQMSALAWIEAGATGTYGTVAEPCNLPGKFPHPGVAVSRYLAGDTLIEAYWKSVLMPGQGVFVGEPLAAPFAPPGARGR